MAKYIKNLLIPVFLIASLLVYVWAAFIIGWEYLTDIRGSDTLAYLSHLKILSDYFPKYPFWNHLEGAGVSLTAGYPILTHTFVIIFSKISGLNLVESLKLVGFLSVPFFSLGIEIFAFVKTRNVLVSFIAGLFYVISPIAWIFLFEWGFYAESVAAIFFPPTLTLFSLYLEKKKRVYLALSSVFLALSILAHPTIATASITFMAVYCLILSFFEKEKLKSLILYAKAVLTLSLFGIFLSAFWFFSFYEYSKISIAGGNFDQVLRIDEYQRNKLNLLEILGFKSEISETSRTYVFRNLSFPKMVSALFVLGAILIFFSRQKELIAFNISLLLLLYASIDVWVTVYMKYLPILSQFASWRSFIYIPRVGIPILAAYAPYSFFYNLFVFVRKYPKARQISASLAGFISVLLLFWVLKDYSSFGAEIALPSRKLDLRDIWKMRLDDPCKVESILPNYPQCKNKLFADNFNIMEFLQICQAQKIKNGICTGNFSQSDVEELIDNCSVFCPAKFDSLKNQLLGKDYYLAKISEFRQDLNLQPSPKHIYQNGRIVEKIRSEETPIYSVFSKIPDDPFLRYDVSTAAVEISKVSPYFKSSTPALPAYINSVWLINRLWGYELSNFYADDPVFADHSALLDIAKWFGIRYIIFNGPSDKASERFNREGFTKIDDQPIYMLDNKETNFVITNKPKVLIIGGKSGRVYDTVFKKANFGIIPYSEAVLIKGKDKIDDYSLEELRNYQMLFLYGYSYSNRQNAVKILDGYIKGGGSVFIDTGWQYESADWNIGDTASFFPITKLVWTNYGKANDYKLGDGLFEASDIDVGGFDPLVWQDKPWGISGGGSLRSWAKPILSVSGGVLVAGGSYGDGRIVWSGMNTLAHIKNFDSNNPESILMARIVKYLLGEVNPITLNLGTDFSVKIDNPDRIEVSLNRNLSDGYGLYFKESFFPYWRVSGEHKIEYAGPGFMYVNLSKAKAGETIVFWVEPMLSQVVGWVATFLGLIFLVFYTLGLAIGLLPKFNLNLKRILFGKTNEEINY